MAAAPDRWRRGSARVGAMELHWIEAGEGPLVLLLHGFPDAPHGWRFQLPALAAAGYRAVAPWLRGYGPSSRPPRVRDYALDALTDDVAGLVERLGGRAAAVVGHDWGGAIAWRLAEREPERLDGLVVLNAPPTRALLRALRRPAQLARSSYIALFQLPWLPERLLAARGLAALRSAVRAEVRRPGAFERDDWARQREALEPPGALTAALHYYRAAGRAALGRRPAAHAPAGPVRIPTLALWGLRDRFLGPWLLDDLDRYAGTLTRRTFPDAGHWVHWDAADAVNAALLDWLGAGAAPGGAREAAR